MARVACLLVALFCFWMQGRFSHGVFGRLIRAPDGDEVLRRLREIPSRDLALSMGWDLGFVVFYAALTATVGFALPKPWGWLALAIGGIAVALDLTEDLLILIQNPQFTSGGLKTLHFLQVPKAVAYGLSFLATPGGFLALFFLRGSR